MVKDIKDEDGDRFDLICRRHNVSNEEEKDTLLLICSKYYEIAKRRKSNKQQLAVRIALSSIDILMDVV